MATLVGPLNGRREFRRSRYRSNDRMAASLIRCAACRVLGDFRCQNRCGAEDGAAFQRRSMAHLVALHRPA
jgi:hypothetical protein